MEGNFSSPNNMLISSPNNGFVNVNDLTEQKDTIESTTEDDTMGFYDANDLPYYYALAQTFAIDDQYFCDVVGPTIPNRFYLLAATSFGHLTTNEVVPPVGGYKPITGTIFDLLDKAGVNWIDYFTDLAQGADFRDPVPPHFLPVTNFFADAAAGTLPPVVFVDPELAGTTNLATDEHPPHDIRAGEFFVAQVINAVRNSPNWKDSIIFLTYDEHGGFFDHMKPPKANQNGALTPDGIAPGQCADLSNPPTSTEPGMGANCSSNPIGTSSQQDAAALCPAFTPNGPYPAACANFNQLGFRVPFVVISPFSKQHYVSHTIGNHGSILRMIEKRFLAGKFLTARDEFSNDLEDLFDFTNSPSLGANVSPSVAPAPNLVSDGNGSCAIQGSGLPLP
jgi:phospholipase C